MEFKNEPMRIESPYGGIVLERDAHGIPEVSAETEPALYYGQGFSQMNDRQLQAYMLKIIFSGRAAEFLNPGLTGVDAYIRSFPFLPEPERELSRLKPQAKENLQAFCDGCNAWFAGNKARWEWKLVGYAPDAWKPEDVLRIVNGFGYVGLMDLNVAAKKFAVQLIRNGVSEAEIRSLFPIIRGRIDVETIKKLKTAPLIVPDEIKWLLPVFSASNNWAVSPRKAGGTALFANDPHLQIDRLPAIWQEMILNLAGRRFKGFTVPGIPGPVTGRTQDLAWGPTASMMDMLEYRIEEIKDGRYRRGDAWLPLRRRTEEIKVKGKPSLNLDYWETEHGLVEGYGEHGRSDGYYLCLHYSAANNAGAAEISSIFEMFHCASVKEGMEKFRTFDSTSFNWVLADRSGHIGYQMSGRAIRRDGGDDGLVPRSAWDREAVPWLVKDDLPKAYDPGEGYIVTANDDMSKYGGHPVQTIPMAAYRADRIASLLQSKDALSVEDMKTIQLDLYSIQAEKFVAQARPYLETMKNGRYLLEWDFRYDADSIGAVYFERYYRNLLESVFGRKRMGKAAFDYLWNESNIFVFLFGAFDRVLLEEENPWFTKEEKAECIVSSLEEALSEKPKRLKDVRKIMMRHVLFGKVLPAFVGFDRGPFFFGGSRATVNQGQFFRNAGMDSSFCPSFRLVADMGDDSVHTAFIGGASDRRFSRYYANDIENYLSGAYRKH